MYGAKVATFNHFGALPLAIVADGLIIGASLMVGSYAARYVVLRMSPATFKLSWMA